MDKDISRLVQLRDKGAITDEELEIKMKRYGHHGMCGASFFYAFESTTSKHMTDDLRIYCILGRMHRGKHLSNVLMRESTQLYRAEWADGEPADIIITDMV